MKKYIELVHILKTGKTAEKDNKAFCEDISTILHKHNISIEKEEYLGEDFLSKRLDGHEKGHFYQKYFWVEGESENAINEGIIVDLEKYMRMAEPTLIFHIIDRTYTRINHVSSEEGVFKVGNPIEDILVEEGIIKA